MNPPFHDLGHTANGFASEMASLRELMARMGHSSTRAAPIYQHARQDRERAIADAVSVKVSTELDRRSGRDAQQVGHALGAYWARGTLPGCRWVSAYGRPQDR